MSRDKQIEEMAEILYKENVLFTPDYYRPSAEALYKAGYRKASDIFEEIDNVLLKCISASHEQLDKAVRDNSHDGMIATTSASEVLKAMRLCIAELKKKYESEGEGLC